MSQIQFQIINQVSNHDMISNHIQICEGVTHHMLPMPATLTLSTVSKDEWDTKEDTGKSMKNALYVLRYAKRHLSGRSDVEQ